MNRYVFILSWLEGSDSSFGAKTNVHSQDDLWKQYCLGNRHIFAVEIWSDSEEIAAVYGRERAWHDNYTAEDTVSDVVLLSEDYVPRYPMVVIKAHPQSS